MAVVTEADQAVRVATKVCSVYSDRNEALVNAGVIWESGCRVARRRCCEAIARAWNPWVRQAGLRR